MLDWLLLWWVAQVFTSFAIVHGSLNELDWIGTSAGKKFVNVTAEQVHRNVQLNCHGAER